MVPTKEMPIPATAAAVSRSVPNAAASSEMSSGCVEMISPPMPAVMCAYPKMLPSVYPNSPTQEINIRRGQSSAGSLNPPKNGRLITLRKETRT
jgi:hypothetical protein